MAVPGGHQKLYGREDLVELVATFAERPRQGGKRVDPRTPVLLLTGPAGSGKTAFLKSIGEQLSGRIPYALLGFQGRESVSGDALSVQALLSELVLLLNLQYGRYGRLAFPRFVLARDVLTKNLNTAEEVRGFLKKSQEPVRAVLKVAFRVVKFGLRVSQPDGGLVRVVVDIEKIIGGPVEEKLSAVVAAWLVFTPLGRRLLRGGAQNWFRDQDDRKRDGIDVLAELSRHSRSGDEQERRKVDRWLWRAFLADLSDNFATRRRSARWPVNVVVLLDDVHLAGGDAFLQRLQEARVDRGADGDPLTLVATHEYGRRLDPGPIADVRQAGRAAWESAGEPARYRVAITHLEEEDVGRVVPVFQHGPRRRLLYGLTGGNPAVCALLAQATAEDTRPEDFATILRREVSRPGDPGGEGIPVMDQLSEIFLRGVNRSLEEALVTCSAAMDLQEARLLVNAGGVGIGRPFEEPLLSPRFWVPSPWYVSPEFEARCATLFGTVVEERVALPPTLRRLLLNRLAKRGPDQQNWNSVHERLRELHRESGNLAGELYHALAGGALESTVRTLYEEFRQRPEGFLTLLRQVVVAPNQYGPKDQVDDVLKPLISPGPEGENPGLDPLRWVVAGLWIDGNPLLGGPRTDLLQCVSSGFQQLWYAKPDQYWLQELAGVYRTLVDKG